MANLIKGENLTAEQKKEIKAAFINRFTLEHRPAWAHREDCKNCFPTHATDEEWIIDHAFYMTKGGKLDKNHRHCEPSWMTETDK